MCLRLQTTAFMVSSTPRLLTPSFHAGLSERKAILFFFPFLSPRPYDFRQFLSWLKEPTQMFVRHGVSPTPNDGCYGVQIVIPGSNPETSVSTKRVQLVIHRSNPASPC